MARIDREKRTARMETRATISERDAIEARASAMGLTASTYIRMSALGAEIPVRKTRIEAEAVAALNRIGSNINQLARIGNSSGSLTADQVKVLIATHKGLAQIAGRINGAISA